MHTKILSENVRERHHFGDFGIEGSSINIDYSRSRVWGFVLDSSNLRQESVGGLLSRW
jgi:hypothetical protein